MFIPLHDQNPVKVLPFQIVTVTLIVINCLVFGWQLLLTEAGRGAFALSYGMVPAVLIGSKSLPPEFVQLPSEATLLTYMFLHGDVWHLLGNMLFLWVFGDNIEDSMGHARFLVFYLLCGLLAGVTHGMIEHDSAAPMIGASGAAAGILGAYLMLHPRVKVLVLAFKIPVQLPAYILIIAWIIAQVVFVALDEEQVAWWAHIGGFFAGAILVIPLRRKSVPLLGRGIPH